MTLAASGPGRGCGFTTPHARRHGQRRLGRLRPAPRLPDWVDGAEWQAGVTPESWKFKVHLDGEPVKNAIAAAGDADGYDSGWVDVRDYGDQADGTSDPLSAKVTRLYGRVEIVPGDD